MTSSTRLYQCLRCHRQVLVCQTCDHGQRYCADQCRQAARKSSCQRANEKYQNSVAGRFNNAARQQRFRQRQRQPLKIVTDQGSPSSPVNDLLIAEIHSDINAPDSPQIPPETVCHFCGCLSGAWFRVGFLKKRTVYPAYSKKLTRVGEIINEH